LQAFLKRKALFLPDNFKKMKKTIIVFVCMFLGAVTFAQKNFEGEIIYKLHANGEDKPDAELKILFGHNKLKLRFKEKEKYDRDELLVVLDSAAYYTLNTENKTYTKKPLQLRRPLKEAQAKNIGGYATTAVPLEGNNLNTLLGSFVAGGTSVFYVADSLFYAIPSAFEGNPVLLAIQKNRIVLGAEIVMQSGMYETYDTTKKQTTITAEAINIKPVLYDETVFIIPGNYVDSKNNLYDYAATDTATVTVDSAAVTAPYQLKKTVKKPVKPAKKKAASQPAAIRRKQ
jgi:hypothetical protein